MGLGVGVGVLQGELLRHLLARDEQHVRGEA